MKRASRYYKIRVYQWNPLFKKKDCSHGQNEKMSILSALNLEQVLSTRVSKPLGHGRELELGSWIDVLVKCIRLFSQNTFFVYTCSICINYSSLNVNYLLSLVPNLFFHVSSYLLFMLPSDFFYSIILHYLMQRPSWLMVTLRCILLTSRKTTSSFWLKFLFIVTDSFSCISHIPKSMSPK